MTNPIYQYYPCDPRYYVGEHSTDQARGVTTWNLENEFTVQPILMPKDQANDSATVIFTCTTPKCYSQANTIEGGFTIETTRDEGEHLYTIIATKNQL